MQIAFYEANEEPEITYAGSMHNAEIYPQIRLLIEMITKRKPNPSVRQPPVCGLRFRSICCPVARASFPLI